VDNIIILGGGSAGWMTAAYLSVHQPNKNITLIESPNIPTIGVGEATTPYLMKFFESIGVTEESEWMPKCNATYKNGVMYEDWDFINSRLWHSFEIDEDMYQTWLRLKLRDGLDNQDYWTSTMRNGHIAMRDSGKWLADKDGNVPDWHHSKSFNGWPQHWAYHIDAEMFGQFLKERTKGVNYIQADITEVTTDNSGISKLIGGDGTEFTADLYIDCTGFSRLLIDKVSNEFKSFEPYLTHDKACVLRRPYVDVENEMKPRTRAKALSSGWYWEIPLYNKISTGYVYTSKYISDEDAENELRNDIGFDKTEGCKAFTVDIKAGYFPNPWTKNVLPIGLSAGFIEPLESTLLFVVQMAGIRLNQVLNNEMTIDEYNKNSSANMGDFLDFISVSYHLSHRADSKFWVDRKDSYITDRMRGWLAKAKTHLQPPEEHILFVNSSWISKLIGFNWLPTKVISQKELDESSINTIRQYDHSKLISQKEYLDRFIYK